MAKALPSPPPSRSASPESEDKPGDLAQRLDSLLEQYLELLDQYTTLREDLSKTFSAGFFSLAQAQRTSTLGVGRRYGQDCYDQRMKAHRQVTFSVDEKDQSTLYNVVARAPVRDPELSTAGVTESTAVESEEELDSKDLTDSTEQKEKEEQTVSNVDSKETSASRDPITWFGILVPSALRRTQVQFIEATEGVIPRLLSIQSMMQTTETKIEALRAALASSAASEDVDDDPTEQSERVPESTPIASMTQEGQKKSDSRRKLASRPAHSKAPLLQLDR